MSPTLLIVGGVGILVALVAGVLVSRSRSRPVRQLSSAIQHVVETKDFQPVAVPNATGEVAMLASWFNRLLRMVARMRERQVRLVLDASHELRNPLTSLRTNVDLLAVDLSNDRLSLDQRTEIVGDVQAQLGELSGLVTDLTHLARDEDEVAPQPLDVCEVVNGAVDRVRRRGQDRVFDVELQPLFMVGHADALERAVVNLLDNAVKWTPAGGTVRVRVEGNRLRVSDEGPGIPEADLPFVFDRFFRGQTGRGTPGTGLGLSIVAKTVEDHSGSVQVGRAASGGAEFTVQLPGVTSREALCTLLQGIEADLGAARSGEAAAVAAAAVAEQAVGAAADRAVAAATTARRARAAAATSTASAMAETVRQRAVAVQDHADAAAREVAAAAAGAASRVASAVLPGQERQARRTAASVARVTTEAAAATARETTLEAAEAARAALMAAQDAAAAADDAARYVDLEVHGTAKVVQDAADAAATRIAAGTQHPAQLSRPDDR
jgi:signal transduction histidine kinase